MEKCWRCERVVQERETPFLWNDQVVCAGCHKSLVFETSVQERFAKVEARLGPSAIPNKLNTGEKIAPLTARLVSHKFVAASARHGEVFDFAIFEIELQNCSSKILSGAKLLMSVADQFGDSVLYLHCKCEDTLKPSQSVTKHYRYSFVDDLAGSPSIRTVDFSKAQVEFKIEIAMFSDGTSFTP
jgi:hypothetical protein